MLASSRCFVVLLTLLAAVFPAMAILRMDTASGTPPINKAHALALACALTGVKNLPFTATYGLATDPDLPYFHPQRLPAWLVTFQGVTINALVLNATHTPRQANAHLHTVCVLLNAQDGSLLEAFTEWRPDWAFRAVDEDGTHCRLLYPSRRVRGIVASNDELGEPKYPIFQPEHQGATLPTLPLMAVLAKANLTTETTELRAQLGQYALDEREQPPRQTALCWKIDYDGTSFGLGMLNTISEDELDDTAQYVNAQTGEELHGGEFVSRPLMIVPVAASRTDDTHVTAYLYNATPKSVSFSHPRPLISADDMPKIPEEPATGKILRMTPDPLPPGSVAELVIESLPSTKPEQLELVSNGGVHVGCTTPKSPFPIVLGHPTLSADQRKVTFTCLNTGMTGVTIDHAAMMPLGNPILHCDGLPVTLAPGEQVAVTLTLSTPQPSDSSFWCGVQDADDRVIGAAVGGSSPVAAPPAAMPPKDAFTCTVKVTTLQALPAEALSDTITVSPDDRHVAYSTLHLGHPCVVLDGKAGPSYDDIGTGSLTFSPDSSRFAYVAKKGETWMAVIDGTEGPAYEDIGGKSLEFSPHGTHVAYAVKSGDRFFMVIDGKEGAAYDALGEAAVVFSPDDNHTAYLARKGEQWVLVRDGRDSDGYAGVIGNSVRFSPDSQHASVIVGAPEDKRAIVMDGKAGRGFDGVDAAYAFSVTGHLGYLAMDGNKFRAVVDGDPSPLYDGTLSGSLRFSPDGKHVAYVAQQGERQTVFLDGVVADSTAYDGFGKPLLFSPDSRHLAYLAGKEGKPLVVLDGKAGTPYDELGSDTLMFSADSAHLAYMAVDGDRPCFVLDGNAGVLYDGIDPDNFGFTPDSKHLAYLANIGNQSVFVVDHTATPLSGDILPGSHLVFDTPTTIRTLIVDTEKTFTISTVELEIHEK